jgi:preprotein translocase subunit SecY
MLSAFTNSLKIPELRQRIFFTAALIFVCRLVSVIPVPGVDAEALRAIWTGAARAATSLHGLLTCSAAGALTRRGIGRWHHAQHQASIIYSC